MGELEPNLRQGFRVVGKDLEITKRRRGCKPALAGHSVRLPHLATTQLPAVASPKGLMAAALAPLEVLADISAVAVLLAEVLPAGVLGEVGAEAAAKSR